MPLDQSETARDDLRRILETCLERLEGVLRDDALEVRDLLAVGKEARSLREVIDELYPLRELPPQEFHLKLTVEGA